jgi:hypothetical protein
VPKLRADIFRIFGVRFSDKSFVYFLAASLAFSEGWRSFLPAVASVLFGIVYAATPLSSLRFPQVLRATCRRFILPLIESPPPAQVPDDASEPPAPVDADSANAAELANQDAALNGAVEELVAMGFDPVASRNALLETGGNVEAAVARLCG